MDSSKTRHNERPVKWLVLALVSVGTFMSTLDASIVTVAMPTLTSAFNTTVVVSQWYVLAYTFAVTIFLLMFGKLGDMAGRRRLYVCGIVVFTAGSAVCGFSISSLMLILARALQGVGSAMVMSCGPALVTDAFGPQERGKSLGLIGTAVALGLLAGPVVGGMIIQYATWRWMFFINIPIGIALVSMMLARVHGFDERRNGPLDIRGAVLMALALAFLLSAATFGSRFGWGSWLTISLFAASGVLAALFIAAERAAQAPILDLRLFREREFAIGTVAGWANYAATMPVAVFIPFYLESILKYPPRATGLMLAFGPATLAFIAPVAGSLSDRIGSRFLTSFGLLIAGIGLLMLRMLGPEATAFDVIWRLVLANLGSAMFVSPNSSSVMGSVPRQDLGVAGGVVALVRNLGMVLGVAIAGAIITTVQRSHFVTGELSSAPEVVRSLSFMAGLKAAFLVSAMFLFAASLISAMRVRPGDREAFDRMSEAGG